jgi:hypothetical protein
MCTTQHSQCWYCVLCCVVDLHSPSTVVGCGILLWLPRWWGIQAVVIEEDLICSGGSILHAHVGPRESQGLLATDWKKFLCLTINILQQYSPSGGGDLADFVLGGVGWALCLSFRDKTLGFTLTVVLENGGSLVIYLLKALTEYWSFSRVKT